MRTLIENLTTPITAPLLAGTLQAATFFPLVMFSSGLRSASIFLWIPWCAIALLSIVAIRKAWRACGAERQPPSALIGLGLNYLYLFTLALVLIAYFSGELTITSRPTS